MRILVADDETRVRRALRVLLQRQPGYQVVGEAKDAEDLLAQEQTLRPDLILLAWGLPGMMPGDLLFELKKRSPDTIIVALSGRPEIEQTAIAAGADSFACKCDPPADLLTILGILRGRSCRWVPD